MAQKSNISSIQHTVAHMCLAGVCDRQIQICEPIPLSDIYVTRHMYLMCGVYTYSSGGCDGEKEGDEGGGDYLLAAWVVAFQ